MVWYVLAEELLSVTHLGAATYEDEGEGLRWELVVRVDGNGVPDDLHQVFARWWACNDYLLDGVGGVEGMPRSIDAASPAIAWCRIPVVADEYLSCGGGSDAQVEVIDAQRAWGSFQVSVTLSRFVLGGRLNL